MKSKLQTISVLISIIVFIGGVIFGSLRTFATNDRVNLVAERLDKKILTDRLHSVQERIWALEDRYGEGCERCDQDQKDAYRRLLQELNDIERELQESKGG